MILSLVDPIANLLGSWSEELNIYSILLRLFLAFIAGVIVGLERSAKQHTTGLRTTLLISIGSCTAMIINLYLGDGSDLTRLSAGVIAGIGFIGAGSIVVNSRSVVTGATSAAAMFVGSILGLTFGCGLYTTGLIACTTVMIVLMCLSDLETIFKKRSFIYTIHVELNDAKALVDVLDYVRDQGFKVKSVNCDNAYQGSTLSAYSINLIAINQRHFIHAKELTERLNKINNVHIAETN